MCPVGPVLPWLSQPRAVMVKAKCMPLVRRRRTVHDLRYQAIERGLVIVAGWPEPPTSRPRPDDQARHRQAVMRIVARWSDVTGALTADHRENVDCVNAPPVRHCQINALSGEHQAER